MESWYDVVTPRLKILAGRSFRPIVPRMLRPATVASHRKNDAKCGRGRRDAMVGLTLDSSRPIEDP
jgi:hypothetical protein